MQSHIFEKRTQFQQWEKSMALFDARRSKQVVLMILRNAKYMYMLACGAEKSWAVNSPVSYWDTIHND